MEGLLRSCTLGALYHQEAHGYQTPTEPWDLPPAKGTFTTMSHDLCLKMGKLRPREGRTVQPPQHTAQQGLFGWEK